MLTSRAQRDAENFCSNFFFIKFKLRKTFYSGAPIEFAFSSTNSTLFGSFSIKMTKIR